MTTSELVQVILMGLLVVITGIYAWRTFAISKATKKQADASMKMTEEIRAQRYSESLPLLIPNIHSMWSTEGLAHNEIPYEYLQTGIGIKVTWRNLGKGVAIDSRFSFRAARLDSSPEKALFFPLHESDILGIGESREIDFHEMREGQWQNIPPVYHPRLEASYRDIYERNITTVQEFRIDHNNKRGFLGELYFTINGQSMADD